MSAAAATIMSAIPSVRQRLGLAQRKLALVKSATVNLQKRGDRDVNRKDLLDAIVEATDEAFLEVFRVHESKTLGKLLDLPAPDDDQLDRAGSAIIDAAEQLLERGETSTLAGARGWNEHSFVLDIVRRARREIGDYAKLHREIRTLNGVVEMLHHTLESLSNSVTYNDTVNLTPILATLEEVRERFEKIYSATGVLAELDEHKPLSDEQPAS